MSTIAHEDFEAAVRAFENQRFDAAASGFAADGVFIDPHYPDPEFRGRDAIESAFEWVFENVLRDSSPVFRRTYRTVRRRISGVIVHPSDQVARYSVETLRQ